jgi:small conductance mechanosensitive channel
MNDVLQGFVEGLLGTSRLTMLQWLGATASRLTLALLIGAVALFIASRVRHAVRVFFKRRKGDTGLELLLGRSAFVLIMGIGLLMILPIFGLSATALVATLGVFGLAVSLAIQDLLKNAVAGIYLLIERPFRPGETIKVRDFVGTVESVDLRTTTLRSEGELVYVPNAILFAEVLVNRGPIRRVTDEDPE